MILDEIIRRTEKRVALRPASFPERDNRSLSLVQAIQNTKGSNVIIAEIKCASPSLGIICRNGDMARVAGVLAGGGCVGLSIRTEPFLAAPGGGCCKRQGCCQHPSAAKIHHR